jgi:hypothetical protein
MNADYLNRVATLLSEVRPDLRTVHKLEFRNCFGAVAGYVDCHIFISFGKFGVALRLPRETLGELFQEKDVLHLKYFPKGHIKKEYAVIPKRILDDRGRFEEFLDLSIRFALSVIASRCVGNASRDR